MGFLTRKTEGHRRDLGTTFKFLNGFEESDMEQSFVMVRKYKPEVITR